MTVLATIGLSEVQDFKNKSKGYRLIPTFKKDGSEGKPKKEFFFLNLEFPWDSKSSLESTFSLCNPEKSIIKTISIVGNITESFTIPDVWKGRVFAYNSSIQVEGLVNLLEQTGTPNLKDLEELSKKYPNARFIGGNLLAVEGIPVGRFEEGVAKDFGILGKEDSKIYFTEDCSSYDFFDEGSYSELEKEWGTENLHYDSVTVSKSSPKIKKVSLKAKKVKSIKKDKVVKPKQPKVKVSKKKEAFSRIFSEKVEF